MNANEPVAWMTKNRYLITQDENLANTIKEKGEEPIIPLYIHPAKTLTDEEIKAVYGEYFDIENCDWLHLQCIQAILKKASEK
jgi:hypothetical protein